MKFPMNSKLTGLLATFAVLPATLAADDSFSLLCYTTTGLFGAAELYYKNGFIMISNATSPSNMTSIYFTRDQGSPSAPWRVSSNTTKSPNPHFSSGALALPVYDSPGSANAGVAVTNSSTGSAADLLLYGETVFARVNGSYQNPFYAATTNDVDVWQLLWNPVDPGNKDLTPVVLRTSNVL